MTLTRRPIRYKILCHIYRYFSGFFFRDVTTMEWGKSPNDVVVNKYKMSLGNSSK